MLDYVAVSDKPNPNNKRNYDISVHPRAIDCFYEGCETPPDATKEPPAMQRPSDAIFWSDQGSWENTEAGWGGSAGHSKISGAYGPPSDGSKVKIPEGAVL